MKRYLAVAFVAPLLTVTGLTATAGSAQAASLCFEYDITFFGQQYAGSYCLPPA